MTPDPDLTLDEWIAAGQGCCGAADRDDDPPHRTAPTAADTAPVSDSGSGA